jgi:hypothetical protein
LTPNLVLFADLDELVAIDQVYDALVLTRLGFTLRIWRDLAGRDDDRRVLVAADPAQVPHLCSRNRSFAVPVLRGDDRLRSNDPPVVGGARIDAAITRGLRDLYLPET